MKILVLLLFSFFASAFFVFGENEGPWQRHTIDAANSQEGRKGADGVRLADINQDGKLDIATGWENGSAIRVCIQPSGHKALRETWPAVTVGQVRDAEDAVFADLDGDGWLDVVSCTEGSTRAVFFHWNPGDSEKLLEAEAWKTEKVPATDAKESWMYSFPLDVDSDGDEDLILGSKGDNATVSLLRNPGKQKARDPEMWSLEKLSDASWIMSLRVFHSGERSWILYSNRKKNGGVYLVPWDGKDGQFGEAICIGAAEEEVMFLDTVDYDEDGKKDIVAAIRPDIVRVFLQPEDAETQLPWPDTVDLDPIPSDLYGSSKAVEVGDIDLDGIPDFVISCESAEKREGLFWADSFSDFYSIAGEAGSKFDRIELLDIDGDGDLDVICCEEREGLGVFWYENPTKTAYSGLQDRGNSNP